MRTIFKTFKCHQEWVDRVNLQMKARSLAMKAIKEGTLIPEPCGICGCLEVDAHHEDYTRPLDVLWLCQSHHMKLHGYEIRMRNRNLPITADGKMRAMLGWDKKYGRARTDREVTIKATVEEK